MLVVVAVLAAAWGVVWLWERRRGRAPSDLEPGLLLVTAAGCALCRSALASLNSAGRPFRVVDAGQVRDLGVRSVPALFLVDSNGAVVARRSGRAAVMSPAELARWS